MRIQVTAINQQLGPLEWQMALSRLSARVRPFRDPDVPVTAEDGGDRSSWLLGVDDQVVDQLCTEVGRFGAVLGITVEVHTDP